MARHAVVIGVGMATIAQTEARVRELGRRYLVIRRRTSAPGW